MCCNKLKSDQRYIDEFINFLKVEKRYSNHTLVSYQTDLNQFFSFIAVNYDIPVSKVKQIQIRSFIVNLMNNNISNRTVNRKISAVKSFYRYLLKTSKVNFFPMHNVHSPKVEKRLPSFVKEKNILFLLEKENYSADFFGLRDYMMINLLYQTGIRLSELIGLKERDVVLSEIKVKGKRDKERIIPIGKQLYIEIQSYLKAKNKQFNKCVENLFISDKGNKLYEKFVYRKVNYYLGIVSSQEKKSPHVIRHTFATHMLNNGADLNAIKEILGHENLSATQVYTHNSFEKLKNIHSQAHPRG